RYDDLKNMLDQNKDFLKLEAMKRIIGMIAKGKNASSLFPAVVKNVACKNIEVKKLVYVYLERYAEEQQDLALLSISTFQRGLKDHNQLIRASALRVLSSIRVPIIVPIMMLAIKDGMTDMSPFVRKTAAHAIPKLYSLDPDQKESLIEIIDKLLSDRTTLVAGSVVMAYQEVCPERVDLVHRHFRKLCNLLVDVDEWGQIAILSMLTRYARTQFTDPNKYIFLIPFYVENETIPHQFCTHRGDVKIKHKFLKSTEMYSADKPFYEEESSSDSDEEKIKEKLPKYVMDPDHRLLLKCSKPLLQSRNSAVVMAVAQLYYHLGPRQEVSVVAKALVRLLRGRREVQAVVLQNIASMTLMRKGIFEAFLKSFYVRSTDPTHIRVMKLEVLTNLATESNISIILREFQTYVRSSDKQFVAHTIQAIARCATNIEEVTDTCLAGLVSLLSNRDEAVVAESIVVIKKLLQMNPSQHCDIIKHMARLVDNIQVGSLPPRILRQTIVKNTLLKVPMAKASILWLIGEYSEFVPKIAPDVLRKATKLLAQYVLQLGKYDQSYDIRDRSRFIRHLIMPSSELANGQIHKHAKKILLAPKPAPVLESPFKGRDAYQLGSLSHAINAEANGYQKLPDFPETQPDPSVRTVEVKRLWEISQIEKSCSSSSRSVVEPVTTDRRRPGRTARSKPPKKKSFYSDEDSSEESESGSSSSGSEDSESDSGDSSYSESESGSDETEGPDSRVSDSDKVKKKTVTPALAAASDSGRSRLSSFSRKKGMVPVIRQFKMQILFHFESSGESGSSSSEEESSEEEVKPPPKRQTKRKKETVNLLDLDDFSPPSVSPSKSSTSLLTPMLASDLQGLSLGGANHVEMAGTSSGKSYELLHRVTGGGLSAKYRYPRSPCIYSDTMITVELEFTNSSDSPIQNIHIGEKKLQAGLKVHDFAEIDAIEPGSSKTSTMGIDFCDTTQPLVFDICTKSRKFNVSVKIPVGELVKPVSMAQTEFLNQQGILSGMNENKGKVNVPETIQSSINKKVMEIVNVCIVPSTQSNIHRYAGKTAHGGSVLLLSIDLSESGEAKLIVNCDKMVIGSMVFKQVKEALTN
uniref:AP-3 complex subunit beta n=1 Tax=Ciona savignyi TaxID=51511 RepID=H2Z3B0_CIOSA